MVVSGINQQGVACPRRTMMSGFTLFRGKVSAASLTMIAVFAAIGFNANAGGAGSLPGLPAEVDLLDSICAGDQHTWPTCVASGVLCTFNFTNCGTERLCAQHIENTKCINAGIAGCNTTTGTENHWYCQGDYQLIRCRAELEQRNCVTTRCTCRQEQLGCLCVDSGPAQGAGQINGCRMP